MAETKFNIHTTIQGLQNLLKLQQNVKKLGSMGNTAFNKMNNKITKMNGSLDQNNKFLSRSADRVGFMAFQFTFLEGIAQRVLGSIRQFFTEVIRDGAAGIESMTRAVAQSGVDFQGTTEDSTQAVKLLNDALLDMGGGGTRFGVVEVGDAMREIGKATDLTGTELQKANKLVGVTQQVLRLMTIEEVDAAEAAKTLVKTMNNFGLSLNDAARVTDVLINVNQSSAITLDELSRSFGFASSSAVEFGLDVETTGALLGVLGNRLGQGAGAAGRNFRALMSGLKQNALKASPALDAMGISILDNAGNMKPFVQFLNEARVAMAEAGQSSDAFTIFLQKEMGLEIRAADALAKLTQATEAQVEAAIAAAKAGNSSGLEKLLGGTLEANMAKIQNSVNVLKVMFSQGLAPAIAEVAKVIRQLVQDNGLQEMALELGQMLGKEAVDAVKMLTGAVKNLTGFFKEHKEVLGFLIKLFIGFIGLLVATLIIASVGKVVAAFVSIMLKLSLVMGGPAAAALTANQAGWIAIRMTVLSIIAVFAGIIIAVMAVKHVMELLTDDVDNADQQMELLVTGGMAALGLGLAALAGGPVGFGIALAAMTATAVVLWLEHIGTMAAFDTAFEESIARVNEANTDWENFGITVEAVLDGMAASTRVTGNAIGEAIGGGILALGEFISNIGLDQFLQDMVDGNWEAAWNSGKAVMDAIFGGMIGLILGFFGFEEFMGKKIEDLPKSTATAALKAGREIARQIMDAIDIGGAIAEGIQIKLGIIADPKGKLDYEDWLKESQKKLSVFGQPLKDTFKQRERGFIEGGNFKPAPEGGDGVGEIVPMTPIMQQLTSSYQSMITWSDDYLGQAEPFKEQIALMAEETIPALAESFAIQKEVFDTFTLKQGELKDSIILQDAVVKLTSTATKLNTTTVNKLTQQQTGLGEKTDLFTYEIAREINEIIDLQMITISVQTALTKLAIEGTEAARRLSTLKVSKKGVFTMGGRSSDTTFSEIGSLQGSLAEILASSIGEKINLNNLSSAQAAQKIEVGGINITIEGSADASTAQAIADAVQEVLNKEITNKTSLLSTVRT